jgi:sterol desaturase/sphingolipid hydroxylase (fatty acid hydroxylase superfamily)
VFTLNTNLIPIIFVLPMSRTSLFKEHTMAYEDLPSPMTLAMSVFFCMLCEDATFYWSHRFLHLPFIYPYIHKMHHSFNQTVSIAAEYTHPIEFALGNLIPTAVGPAILGPHMHIVTVFAWYLVRVGETLDGHCGYDFSFSPYRLIPLSGSAEYHDFHHSRNVGNYGSFFSIWDSVWGTNKVFYEHLESRQRVA